MAIFTISTFATFAGLLLAAKKLAMDPDPVNRLKAIADLASGTKALAGALGSAGLTPLAKAMETCAHDADAAFARDPAADGARALFWQVVPTALADPALMTAGGLDASAIADGMVSAILISPHGADFGRTPMAERYFRAVALPTLTTMLASADFIASITPDLWRRVLRENGIQIEMLGAIKEDTAEILALVRDLHAAKRDEAHRAGVTDERILTLARRVAADVPDLDRAFAELDRAVTVAIEVQTRGAVGSNTGHFVDEVLTRMAALSAESRDTEAAAEADRAFAEWEDRQRLETQKGIALLEAGLRADLLRRDPRSAARRIARKLALESPDPTRRFSDLRAEQDVWYVRGRDQGLNFDLEVSIELARITRTAARDVDERTTALVDFAISLQSLGERESGTDRLEQAAAACRAALEEWTRDRVPLDWARTQTNLGNALARLGEREGGTTRLEEAVGAYRAALEGLTRDRVPLDWARAQMNLGTALQKLGERETGTERLEQAEAAYRAALEEMTRDRMPADWATMQMNLGTALKALGERETGTERLEEAVAAYRAALEETTRDRVPLKWATAQMGLGNALQRLGEREDVRERLEDAVAAYRDALEEMTRDRAPLDWATTQMNLGIALAVLGARESGTERLEEAVATYRAALEERTRDRVPLDWAMAQMNLGNALVTLGERESGTARLEEAVAAYHAALEERTRERVPLDWAMAQMNLGTALRTLGERESGTARLEEAVAAYRAALEERTRERVPLDWAMTQVNLGNALQTLGARENGTARLEEAVAAYRVALEEQTRERVPLDWATTQMNLGAALRTLGARENGTARLEEAIAAYSAALEERTRERVPLDWAMTQANLAAALAAMADRTGHSRGSALAAIEAAIEVFRDAGTDHYLRTAEGIRRLVTGG